MHRKLRRCNINVSQKPAILAVCSGIWMRWRSVGRCGRYRRYLQGRAARYSHGYLLRGTYVLSYDKILTDSSLLMKACLLGVALSPITGGTAAHYWSWRSLHSSLGVWGSIEMVLIYLFFPETSHPHPGGIRELTAPFNFVWINPFSSLWLLRSPNIMAVVRLCFSSDCTLP